VRVFFVEYVLCWACNPYGCNEVFWIISLVRVFFVEYVLLFWTSFIVLSYLLRWWTITIYCCDNNYFVLSYFVYHDLHNWYYDIILRHFGPNFKLLSNYYYDEIVLISYNILGGWLGHMIVYFVLPYFIYYDFRNCCYNIILKHFKPSLKLLLWWDGFNLI